MLSHVRLGACAAICSLLPLAAASPARADILLQDDFSGGGLDPQKWAVNTNIDRGPASVVVVNQHVEITNRGHLITASEFDPSTQGPLRITGTWVFGRSGGPGGDFMQILTRSDGVPNNANFGETTNGIEFMANANGGGILFISQRLNGATATLASAPMPLAAGETYAFDIFDDGLNLSFNFRELDGAQISATIVASSALAYTTNRIVFHNRESNNGGFSETSLLDDVVITRVQSVPEPGGLILLGSGLVGLTGLALKSRRRGGPSGNSLAVAR